MMKKQDKGKGKITNIEAHSLGARNFALREIMRIFRQELEGMIDYDPYSQKEFEDRLAVGYELHIIMLQNNSPHSNDLYVALKLFEHESIIKKNNCNEFGE